MLYVITEEHACMVLGLILVHCCITCHTLLGTVQPYYIQRFRDTHRAVCLWMAQRTAAIETTRVEYRGDLWRIRYVSFILFLRAATSRLRCGVRRYAFCSVYCSKWAELANRSRKFSARFGSRFLRELLRAARGNKSVRHVSDVMHDYTKCLWLCDCECGWQTLIIYYYA